MTNTVMSPAPLPVSQCGSVVPMCCRLRQSVVVRGENCGVAWLASLVMALPRKGRSSLLREIIRRLGDSLTACVTTAPAPIKRVSPVESNYFLASDNNDQEIDPSDLLDHWLRELDSAKMDVRSSTTHFDYSYAYKRKYKRRSVGELIKVEDEELLAILEDLSDLEFELEQEIEIVQQRQEAARLEMELQQMEKERTKAENIQIAIEKIKEASVKKMYIKVFTSDGCAKSLLVDETMTVGHVTRILSEKNLVHLNPLWALVELSPELHVERVYEDHELLVENCLMWKPDSKNTIWFMERPEKFDIFQRPQEYFGPDCSGGKEELFDKHFSTSTSHDEAPLEVSGNVWIKFGAKKSWTKHFCILKSTGVYWSNKKASDMVCLATLDVNHVYYGVNWRQEHKSPTDFCFAIKHPQIQARNCKNTKYFSVDTEMDLHRWVTGIRLVKHGAVICDNYRDILELMEDNIEPSPIYTSDLEYEKRFLKNFITEDKLLTPCSDQTSFDSAISSRAASEISEVRSAIERSLLTEDQQDGLPLPPPPLCESLTSLAGLEQLPPPPALLDTTIIIPAHHSKPDSAVKEKSFKTFFEDVWFEETSYKAA